MSLVRLLKRHRAALALLCLLSAPHGFAHAQNAAPARVVAVEGPWNEGASTPLRTVERYALSAQLHGGGARAPFFTRNFPSTLGHGLVLQLAGAYRLGDNLLLSVVLPLSILEVAQPAGSYVDTFSWGNANLTLTRRDTLWTGSQLRLLSIASVSAALPIAQWGPHESLLGLRALQIASAMDGLRQQELYTSGTLPIAATYGVLLEQTGVGLEASVRLPLFLRFSRADLPGDAEVRWLALTPVVHLAARYTPAHWVDLTLAADTVFNGLAPVRATREEHTTQLSLSPAATVLIRRNFSLRADFVLPVAGALGGNAYAGGLTLGFAPR